MYDKYEIKPLMGLVPNKDCDCKKKKDTCKKIEIKPECRQPHFAVPNYFSELVHEWEKEAARYNLGIQELQSIEYKTEVTDEGERLTKVIFKYRKGHELFTREFYVAPRGEKGDKGDTGKNGASAFEIANVVLQIRGKAEFPNQEAWIDSLKGDKGDKGADAKPIKSVIVEYTTELNPTGSITEDTDGYILTIRLNKPEINIEETIDKLITYLLRSFYDKDQINSMLDELRRLITLSNFDYSKLLLKYNSNNSLSLLYNNNPINTIDLADYTLSYENNYLQLLRNGLSISRVNIISGSENGLDTQFFVRYIAWHSYTSAPPKPGEDSTVLWGTGTPTATTEKPYIWMAVKSSRDWVVIRLTGEAGKDGKNGKDGKDGNDGINGNNTVTDTDTTEFAFFRTTELLNESKRVSIREALNDSNNIPKDQRLDENVSYKFATDGVNYLLYAHPQGITKELPNEYIVIRVINKDLNGNETFSLWITPVLWSRWGFDGRDGDGIKYIYMLTNFDQVSLFPNSPVKYNPEKWPVNLSGDYIFAGADQLYTDNRIKCLGWKDNPQNVSDEYPFQWMSVRKKSNGEWGKFSTPVIWNKYIAIDSLNPNVILNVTPSTVSYVNGEFKNYNITVSLYYGLDELKIISVAPYVNDGYLTENANGVYISDTNSVTFNYTANNTSNTKFRVYFYKPTVETLLLDHRDFELTKLELPSTYNNTYYWFTVEPSNIIVEEDGKAKNLTVTTYKNNDVTDEGSILWKRNRDGNPNSISSNNDNTTYNIDLSNEKNWMNGDYITIEYNVNNVLQQAQIVTVTKNSQNILSPFIVRNRGLFKADETYLNALNNKDEDGNVIFNQPGVNNVSTYIDIVSKETEETDSETFKVELNVQYYRLANKSELKPESWDDNDWEEAYSIDFAYIELLVSEIIKAKSVQTNELLVTDKDGEKIVAGMTSGNRINPDKGLDIRIWAGTDGVLRDLTTGVIQTDLTNAPFRVYNDGHVAMQSAEIALSTLKSNQDIQLPKWTEGTILYFTITDNNAHKVSVIDDSKIMFFNGSSFSKTQAITINDNGVYFVCGSIIDGERIWSVTHTVYKTIIKNALLEETRDITITSVSVNADDGTVSVYGTIPTDWPSRTYKGCSISINPISYRYYDSDREGNDSDNALGDLSNTLLYFTSAPDVDFSDIDAQLVATSYLMIRPGNDNITDERYYFDYDDSLGIGGISTTTLQDKIKSLILNPRAIRYYNLDIVLSIQVVETNTGLLIDSIDRTICGEIYTNENEELISNFTNKDCIFTIKKSELSSPTTVYVPSLSTISFAEAQDNYNDYYLEEHQAAVNP